MRSIVTLVAVAVLAAAPCVRGDESLGAIAEKAKKERQERRAQAGSKPVKSFTDADLKGGGASSPPVETAADADKPAADANAKDAKPADKTGKAEKTDDQIRAEKRAEIQKKIDEQRQRMQQMDAAMAAAQAELSDLTNYTFGTKRASLQKVLDDGQAEKAKAQQAIEGLQEEARRLGVPVS
jgi:hypothetical protein